MAAASTAADGSTSASSTPLPDCSRELLQASQDHIGKVAEVSTINEMAPVTFTISNAGPECGELASILDLQPGTNQSDIAWPKIYWSFDGGPWTASSSQMVACQQVIGQAPPECLETSFPEEVPIPNGQSTLAVALDFTSWNDSLYSFSGAISLNYEGSVAFNGMFGPNGTNDWLLNCPTCIVEGSTVLPPGVSPTSGAGSGGSGGSQRSGAGASSSALVSAKPSATGTGPSVSAAPTVSTTASADAGSTSAAPSPDSSTTANVDLTASTTGDSLPLVVGIGIAAVFALTGGAFFVLRKRRQSGGSAS